MHRLFVPLSVVALLFANVACGAPKGGGSSTAAAKAPTTEEEKTLYALGLAVGRSLGTFSLTPAELEMVKKGITDQVAGEKPAVELEAYQQKLQDLARSRQTQAAEKEKEKAKTYIADTEKEKGAEKTASGLVYVPLKEGEGGAPQATDTVKVHYEGKLTNGNVFDSSVKRGTPAEFPLNQVIPCWTEGVQKMKVGGKAKLVCPSAIAYGDQGRPPAIPGGATLVFEVELIEIVKKQDAPPTPQPQVQQPAQPQKSAQQPQPKKK